MLHDVHDYQDDLDTNPNKKDRATEEQMEQLDDRAGIPRHELAHELKQIAIDEEGRGDEDRREHMEDADENMGMSGKVR